MSDVKDETTVYGVIVDETTGKELKVAAGFDCGKLCIRIDGYGEKVAEDTYGNSIIIDYFNKKLSVVIWGDVNNKEPTHIIDLEGALESKRKE